MRRLVVAGLVYLTGIAVILLIKPQFMFREDGRWKEFGIGRDPTNFTHIPFWLFTILWSILSYIIVVFFEGPGFRQIEYEEPRVSRNLRRAIAINEPMANKPMANKLVATKELTPGYYMLNEGSTGRDGVPRYVYLGPEEP
jgi:hypothetical protein